MAQSSALWVWENTEAQGAQFANDPEEVYLDSVGSGLNTLRLAISDENAKRADLEIGLGAVYAVYGSVCTRGEFDIQPDWQLAILSALNNNGNGFAVDELGYCIDQYVTEETLVKNGLISAEHPEILARMFREFDRIADSSVMPYRLRIPGMKHDNFSLKKLIEAYTASLQEILSSSRVEAELDFEAARNQLAEINECARARWMLTFPKKYGFILGSELTQQYTELLEDQTKITRVKSNLAIFTRLLTEGF